MPPRRAPMRRTGLAASRKRLAGQSKKRKAGKPQRDEVRTAVFARDGWRCWLARDAATVHRFPNLPTLTIPDCMGPLTPHHRRKAGAGGAYIKSNLVTLCSRHNRWVEDANDDSLRERYGTWLLVREGDSGWNELGERSNRHG